MGMDDKRSPNVLIVDDEPEVAKALRRILIRRGFAVETVTSAAEALDRLDPLAPDIVISDYRMPGMKGPELLDEVKRRAPAVARFLISGQMALGDAAGGVSAAGHRMLPKPWDNDELVAALHAALGAERAP
ncbi:MAG: response regulator [Anaeromyxobacteraceae bacterium]